MVTTGLPWLEPRLTGVVARLTQGRPPQALLVHGPAGVGRHALASSIALHLLGAASAAPGTGPGSSHPDLLLIAPEADRRGITVGQIRELIHFAGLTSHGGGRKVAIISPAEAMTPAAANSLLKTLEEPPGPTTIILVAQAPARLPPTIVSRCERLRVTVPATDVALAWLHTQSATEQWPGLLAFAGGAPLRAREAALAGEGTILARLAEDLERLGRREESPLAVARQWGRLDGELCLRWLYGAVARIVRSALLGPGTGHPDLTIGKLPLPNPSGPLNIPACYEYLDRLQQVRRLLDRGLNLELQLAELLMWWFGEPGYLRHNGT